MFAPWSLEKRLRRVVEVFQEGCPTTPVRFTTGTPGQLIRRVEAGARPDVYVAMGPAELEVLDQLGVVARGSAREILKQRLMLVVSAGARKTVRELRDLASKEVKAVGIGRPTLTAGRLAWRALNKLGIAEAVKPKARISPLRSLIVGQVQAAVVYEQCAYEEDLHVGDLMLRRGIAFAKPLPEPLCPAFAVSAAALRTGHPDAAAFIQVLGEERAQDILRRRGPQSCPMCEIGR